MSRLLVECGQALYGERWQTSLARDLGVADRTVRRWTANTNPVPPGVYAELLFLMQQRASKITEISKRIAMQEP